MISVEVLTRALDQAETGFTIADASKPDMPLIWCNQSFLKMTGYHFDEVIGRNCRFLQGGMKSTETREIADAISANESCTVTLRNRRKNGERFWNELTLSPVVNNSGSVTHYLGMQKDVSPTLNADGSFKHSQQGSQHRNQELEHMVMHDSLTGLYNRRAFDEMLEHVANNPTKKSAGYAVLMIDVDFFKRYNDHYGHPAGDSCLKTIATQLGQSLKRSNETIARYGGEEFVALLADVTPEQAKKTAQLICSAIAALKLHHSPDSGLKYVTVSVGVAHGEASNSGEQQAETINIADQALYTAKSAGRNQICLADKHTLTKEGGKNQKPAATKVAHKKAPA